MHDQHDDFSARHLGPRPSDLQAMLDVVGVPSLDALIDETVPKGIRLNRALDLPPASSEAELLEELHAIAAQNKVTRVMIGQGYSDVVVPGVIQRNILENPGWYTAYTPYQAEISQGRLEALLNYQTMICDLTAMEISNASLLDEGTAAAEAMAMALRLKGAASTGEGGPKRFFVAADCHPQTIAVVQERAQPLGIEIVVDDVDTFAGFEDVAGALVQNPATDGRVRDLAAFIGAVHAAKGYAVVAADLLSLCLMKPPGEQGADVVVGSSQRFGVPLGYGGPHAAFLSTKQAHARAMPGRLIGVSEDAQGRRALRMALQTREQHIRREKATSNVCTAQVLLAVMASMYAVWHGPDGLTAIAARVYGLTSSLASRLAAAGFTIKHHHFFDTLAVTTTKDHEIRGGVAEHIERIWVNARAQGITLRNIDPVTLGIALDETTTAKDVDDVVALFAAAHGGVAAAAPAPVVGFGTPRTSPFLTHPVFNSHKSETEMLRYIRALEQKDYSLVHGMIPLGSCTMKLNATTEMVPVTWRNFSRLHPFAPVDDAAGYQIIFRDLERWLAELTGFDAVSLQPNAGSQGEYAGMLVIRAWHESRQQGHRRVCLIPQSAHGTNPASAVMAGLDVVVVKCDDAGNIDVKDLKDKVATHKDKLAALMVTYPSTHGVFEESIVEVCRVVHDAGGQVYMDGANMNAQVGICRPGDIGADVCHLNLHKTFCIPHGGGGPGVGPIGVGKHLAPFLPGHPVVTTGGSEAIGPISAAPWGSASILLISWAYIKMMGAAGLKEATRYAILNANYIAKKLEGAFPVLYKGSHGRVAHECILDVRQLKSSGVEAEDVAKRLMDYGFHAPTLSFPVAGTLMVEPTESEPLAELDRFCSALIAIKAEIDDVIAGKQPKEGNVLKNAPHTARVVTSTEWTHPYSREQAAFPTAHTRAHKYWPTVGRVNNVLGDRKLVCTCPPMSDYE
ncbi:MAG: aminomethyl-transferring glycine dehydrogenase [Deltaproteobacteria bacterium]|nr:aminomethyl-transferring glycine dehydrogenase [Deltaproteobacteria bacterium]